jgi:hypothetical protein
MPPLVVGIIIGGVLLILFAWMLLAIAGKSDDRDRTR